MKEVTTQDSIVVERAYAENQPRKLLPRNHKYYLCHFVFFFLGICHFLPMSFFAAANNFWMHKFRNLSDPDAVAANRTFLQKNYASAATIANTVPSLIFGILNVTHSHRIKIKTRLIGTLIVEVIIFLFLTIGSKVNTDDIQVEFFAFVLICYGTLAGANTVNVVASQNLYTRFPLEFMKTALIGEGAAGIVGDLLNIMTVWIFNGDVTNAALMYFISGTFVVALTFTMNLFMSTTDFFNHYLESVTEDLKKKLPGIKEIGRIVYKIRFAIALNAFTLLGFCTVHWAVTSLVVSEKDPTTSSWAKSYFSPVMTFLLSDTCLLLGRATASYLPLKMSESWFLIVAALRTVILVPFIWLCNAQPRHNIPVLFPYDYQYAIILAVIMLTTGYYISTCSLVIPQKVEKHESDLAFTLMGLGVNIVQSILSPIGTFVVNFL